MESKAIKILAIDDNNDNLIILKALIKDAFPTAWFFSATTGKKGIEMAIAENPCVILLDVVMPEMDGFKVCKKLKANKKLCDIPVIFITAIKDDSESRIKGLEAGAEAFLAKPVDISELTAQIRAMVKINHANLLKQNEKEHLSKMLEEQTHELKITHKATLNLLDDLNKEVDARKEIEKALRESEQKFSALYMNMIEGAALHKIIYNKQGEVEDYIIVETNIAFEKHLGIPRTKSIGKTSKEVYGVDQAPFLDIYSQVVKTGKSNVFDIYFPPMQKHFAISAYRPAQGYFATIFNDITEQKKAEELLQQNEKKYRLIAEKIHDVVWQMDLNGISQFVSPSIERFTGFTVKEYLNQTLSNRFAPESAAIAIEVFKNEVSRYTLLEVPPKDYQKLMILDYLCKDGGIKTGEVLITPNFDDGGKCVGLYGVTRDITERKNALKAVQESEEKFREMADMLPQIVFETDVNGVLNYVNKQAYKILGYPEDYSIKGLNTIDFYTPEDKKRAISNISDVMSGNKISNNEYTMIRKDGSTFRALIYINPIFKDTMPLGLRGIIVDITEQKKSEDQIKKLNETLEERVIERTIQLEAANQELEAFSFSVSHDLRAPLRAIHGFTQILEDEYANKFDEEGKRICAIIEGNTRKMGMLIDDLLGFSRLSRTQIQKTEVNMKSIIENIYLELTNETERTKINFQVDTICSVPADSTMIGHVWSNLISNAIKYSSKSEKSIISISSRNENNTCVYCIKDNGVGFDMNYVHKLFGVFQRLHTDKEFEGTGVGLAIVQRVIHRHGGKVWAKAEVNKGAEFYFSLPLSHANPN
ncbi:MAG: PAS domain S-box protein [Bacteroidota bacterium]